ERPGGEALGDGRPPPVDHRALPGVLGAPHRRGLLPAGRGLVGRVAVLGHRGAALSRGRNRVRGGRRPNLHVQDRQAPPRLASGPTQASAFVAPSDLPLLTSTHTLTPSNKSLSLTRPFSTGG